jgi:hypothetical protein
VRILLAVFCNAFVLANSSHDLFKRSMGIIETINSMSIALDYCKLDEGDLSRFCKWVQIAAVKYMVDKDKVLLAKSR